MAKRPIETRLHDLLDADPRAAWMAPHQAFAWVRFGRLVEKFGGLDTIRFGLAIRSLIELAAWLRISVTELDEMVERGVLVAVEGGLAFPAWVGLASPRALAARENGRKRKAAGAEELVPEQRQLPLVSAISGGRPLVTDATSSSLKDSEEEKKEVAAPASGTEQERLAAELGAMVGLSEAQVRRSVGQVDVWLRNGMQPATMRAVIGRMLQRKRLPRITGLTYFAPAMADAADHPQPAVVVTMVPKIEADPVEEAARKAWSTELAAWQRNGCMGPMPPRVEVFVERARAAAA